MLVKKYVQKFNISVVLDTHARVLKNNLLFLVCILSGKKHAEVCIRNTIERLFYNQLKARISLRKGIGFNLRTNTISCNKYVLCERIKPYCRQDMNVERT